MSEWLKERSWKGRVGLVLTAGSNPALSVTIRQALYKFSDFGDLERFLDF